MADEPNNPIESELEAWSRDRAATAPGNVELHPATRRVLQGEAARVHGRPQVQTAAASPAVAPWWRGWLVGATAVFTVAVALFAIRKDGAPLQMARQNAPAERIENEAAGRSMPPASVDGFSAASARADVRPAADKDLESESRTADAEQKAKVTGALVATSTTMSASTEEKKLELAAASVPALATPAPAAKETALAMEAGDASARTQRFSQTVDGTPLRKSFAAPQWPVLQDFELTLTDRRLSVRDQDGSQYSGLLSAQQAFVVTGRNLSLGEDVRFEGMLEQSNRVVQRVAGRAQIGSDRQLTVDARPSAKEK